MSEPKTIRQALHDALDTEQVWRYLNARATWHAVHAVWDDIQPAVEAYAADAVAEALMVERIAEALRVVVGSDYFDGMETHPFAPVAEEEEEK